MKRPNVLVLLLAWAALVLTSSPAVHAADAATSTITGQVSNAATGAFLEGAVVELTTIGGARLSAITDREGRYQFNGVRGDQASLEVRYAGLDPERTTLVLSAGGRLVRDVGLTSQVYQLDRFTVAGEREGTAKAEVLQRTAANVKAIVSSDTFGNAADANVGNLLQKMVGITADYNGPDVRQISIRGVGAALNSVTMDGQQVASAQSAGTGRQFEFEQVSLGNIESIEVTKAPTPDMDGASIGGSVNLVTKSAFDRSAGRLFTYSAGVATGWPSARGGEGSFWKQPIRGFGPSLNFMYSDVVGEKKNIGITWTFTMHSQPSSAGLVNGDPAGTSANSFERKVEAGPVFNYSTDTHRDRLIGLNGQRPPYYTFVGGARSRAGSGVKLDYRWNENTTLSFSSSYNFFHEINSSGAGTDQTVSTTGTGNNVLATINAAGQRTGGGFIDPNYSMTHTRIFAGPNSRSAYNLSSNDKSGRTYLFNLTGRTRFDSVHMDYSLGYSNAATYYDVSHDNEKYDSRPKGDVTYELPNIGWIADRSQDSIWPTIRQTEGPDMFDLNNYRNLRIAQNDRRGFDSVWNGKFDFKKTLATEMPLYFKTGISLQQQKRKFWRLSRRWNYAGADGIFGNADDNQNYSIFVDVPGSSRMNPFAAPRHKRDHPELWKEDIAFGSASMTNHGLISERVAALYAMGNIQIRKLSILAGVRMEDTLDKGTGPLNHITPEEQARRSAWVGTVTDAEQARRNRAQFGGYDSNRGEYRFFLPGVHLKYEPIPNLIGRLSWSTGVGRPPFGDIVPNTNINETGRTVTISNPDLEPQYSNNIDVSLEYYFRSQGLISVGAFRKKIQDYIETSRGNYIEAGANNGYEGEYVGYEIITKLNSGEATIEGIEANFQQQLTYLPGWMKGLGVFGNFTKLRTHGTNSAFMTGPSSSAGGTIAGFLDVTGNVGVSFRGGGFDLRLQSNYRGKYMRSNNANPALVQWQLPKWSTNWKSRYNFSRNFGVFLDIDNMFETPLDNAYAAYRDRIVQYRTFSLRIATGISGRF